MRATLLSLAILFAGCGSSERPFCDDHPALPELKSCDGCAPTVREQIVSPDRQRSFHIAFVAEGFPREQLGFFDSLTRGWLERFERRMDDEVPGLTPMLNVSWIDFRELAPQDGLALGSCGTQIRGVQLSVDSERFRTLIPSDRFDVVVIVVNTPTRYRETGGLALYGGRTVIMANTFTDADTFAHEMGHALFGLHDEYSEIEGGPSLVSSMVATDEDLRAVDSAVFLAPNISLSPTSPKFGGATVGIEGGMGFTTGVYRWGGACLMNDSTSPFCPVCRKAAQERVRARRSASVTNPKCGLRVSPSPTSSELFDVAIVAHDWDGLSDVKFRPPEGAWQTLPSSEPGAQFRTTFTSFRVPARDAFTIEASCVDSRGQQSDARLELTR
ncbi:MAG: M64 family metallopeptidase [Archangium sp.]